MKIIYCELQSVSKRRSKEVQRTTQPDVQFVILRGCTFQIKPPIDYLIFIAGEHCDVYVKKFEVLFGSNRNGPSPGNGGIN